MHLSENITFAVLIKDGNWKTDLTIRFCEYFSHKLNGEDFIKNIVFPTSIDEALEDCNTDYLLIQSDGHIPFKKSFFEALERSIERDSDIFLAHIELAHDYLLIDKRCIFVNMKLWRAAGKPAFASQVRDGPRFKVSKFSEDKNRPHEILLDETSDDRIFVPHACSVDGANFAICQLKKYGKLTSLSSVISSDDSYHLDASTPYREIHTETFFEKRFLTHVRSKVFALENDDMSNIKNIGAEIVVCSAQGLKPLNLVEYFKPKKLVIFDSNPNSLELQKMIFGVDTPTLYSDIVETFKEEFPDSIVVDGWEEDQYAVVQPIKNITVEYKLADAFSFEIEDVIKSIDHKCSAVFDFSDIFVYPYNYYRRPLYQVQGLFAEIYSLMKSRTGSTHILGYAPGFLNMDKVEVNTSSAQYEMDPTFDPTLEEDAIELAQEELIEETVENKVQDATIVEAQVEEKPVVVEEKQSVVFSPPISLPPEDLKPVVTLPISAEDASPPVSPSVIITALDKGYTKTTKMAELLGFTRNITLLYKLEVFEDWTAVFEYYIDEITSEWSFKVGKEGLDKRVEFSNGLSSESFLKHLNQQLKINPKTAFKYFKDSNIK